MGDEVPGDTVAVCQPVAFFLLGHGGFASIYGGTGCFQFCTGSTSAFSGIQTAQRLQGAEQPAVIEQHVGS